MAWIGVGAGVVFGFVDASGCKYITELDQPGALAFVASALCDSGRGGDRFRCTCGARCARQCSRGAEGGIKQGVRRQASTQSQIHEGSRSRVFSVIEALSAF